MQSKEANSRRSRSLESRALRGLAVLATLVLLVRVGRTIDVFSNAWDEPVNIAAATAIYDVHKHVMNTEHPPVVPLIVGASLHLSSVHLPENARGKQVVDFDVTTPAAIQIMFHGPLTYEQLLRRARYPMLLFPVVTLLYVYLLGAWLADEWAAMFAVLFLSTDPTLLAHSMWVGTDVAACAGFLAAIYHGLRWTVGRRPAQAVWAGIACGIAFACKFSCIFALPALGILMIVRPLPVLFSRVHHKWRVYRRRMPPPWQMAAMGAVFFLTVWATYLFDIGRVDNQSRFPIASAYWKAIPTWLKQKPIPMPSMILGALFQMRHSVFGQSAYLNGRVSATGFWNYYPEALVLKSPLALLLGLFVSTGVLLATQFRGGWRVLLLAVPPVVLMLAAMSGRIDMGIRILIPLLPFLYLIVALQLTRLGRRGRAVLAGLIALSFVETARVAPDYIGFFNALAGGPRHGERYLSDSNLDWGHDLKRLAEYFHSPAAAHRAYTLDLFCNPEQPLIEALGMDGRTFNVDPSLERGGLVAISKTLRDGNNKYQWLSKYPLVKQIGTSIDVYDLGPGRTIPKSGL